MILKFWQDSMEVFMCKKYKVTWFSMNVGTGGVVNSTRVWRMSWTLLCRWRIGSAMNVRELATLADRRGRVVGKGSGESNCCCVFSCCNSFKNKTNDFYYESFCAVQKIKISKMYNIGSIIEPNCMLHIKFCDI